MPLPTGPFYAKGVCKNYDNNYGPCTDISTGYTAPSAPPSIQTQVGYLIPAGNNQFSCTSQRIWRSRTCSPLLAQPPNYVLDPNQFPSWSNWNDTCGWGRGGVE